MNHNTKNSINTRYKNHKPNHPRQYDFLCPLIICLLSFAATPVYAATYYVDANIIGGDNDGTSWTNAWDTLAEALSGVSDGDTVLVATGDYTELTVATGELFGDYVTFQAYNGAQVNVERLKFEGGAGEDGYLIFDGFTITQAGNYNYCIKLAGFSYMQFLNCTLVGNGYTLDEVSGLTNGVGFQIYGSCTNITIDNCDIGGTTSNVLSGFICGIHCKGDYITVSNCEISEIHTGVYFDQSTNIELSDCTIHNACSDNIAIVGIDTALIEGNDVYDLEVYKPTLAETPENTTWSVDGLTMTNANAKWNTAGVNYAGTTEIWVTAGTNALTQVDNTYVTVDSDTQITLSKTIADGGQPSNVTYYFRGVAHTDLMQANAPTTQSDNITIRNNKFHDSDHQICWFNTPLAPSYDAAAGHTWVIENNLFYNQHTSASDEELSTVRIGGIDGLIFRNNIVIGTVETANLTSNYTIVGNIISKAENWGNYGEIAEESYNIVNRDNTDFNYNATSLFLDGSWNNAVFDSLFTDAPGNDFTLANGSTAINFGDADNDPSADILDITRNAEHHSAGAYEFTGPALDSIGDKDVDEGEELAFSISAHDINGDPITYSATGTAITAGGVLTGPNFAWTPNGSQAGTYQVTFTATAGGQTDFETITITVNNIINTAPILASIGSKSGSEGLLIGFTTSASDSDFPANDLTFSLEGTPPTGASIDAVTGYFTWVPTEAQGPGTYNVTVRVTDDGTGNLYDEEVVAITVGEVNTPPTLDVSDFDDDEPVDELEELTFTATATDTDVPSNTLTYSLINAPAGASIGSSSGIFTWTPTEAQGPGSYNATVRVTDNGTGSLYDEETINISVTETNTTPVLDPIGNKATNVGSQLTFTADATDTDVPANTLTYSLTTAPAGASIGSETGVFTWTPSSGYEQTFNVTVRVTDDGAGNLFDEEAITITVGPDVTDPTVTNLSPADADVQVSIDSLIILTIADAGIGVDLDTVTIDVEGDRIYDGGSETSEGVYESTGNAQTVKGICRRTGTSAAYSFFFQADARFDYEKNITVTVNASDLASTSNDMAEQSYSFYTVMREFEGNIKVNSDTGTLVQDRPAVAKDSDGNIWTVWYQTTIAGDTDIYIGKLAANDSVFGESTQVTSDTNNQRNAVIAIDSNNKMYLAWQDFRQGEWDIYLTTSTDGVTFSTETRITDPNSNQINPDMAIDSSDKVYIVWEDDQNSNNDIYIASSTNSFASKTTSQITSNASGQGSPAIAIDSAKTVYVVWTDARNASNDIYGATSTSGPWTNAAIVNNANGQSSPVIATETSGTVLHLLWVDDTSGNNDIFYGATTGGLAGLPLTGTDISDDTTSSDQSNPSIFATGTTGSDLRVFACWKDSRDVLNNNGDTDIYYGETALGGSTFGTNVLVNDDSGTNTQSVPVVNVDINGNPYLAWVDNRGGNKDIYYAGAMLMGSVLVTSPLITVGTGGTVEVDDTTSNIDSATDVRVVIPAGTLPADTTITISEMINPPSPPSGGFGVNYEFGPSGLVFNSPVAIYLPHAAADCPGHAIYRAYWYNQELSAWYPPGGIAAQHGVDPVSGVHYITFETDHFTGFGVGGGSAGGGGGGGGCSMSPDGQGTIVEFLVPYIGLAIVMAIMKLKGRRKKNLHRYTGSD